MKSFVDTKLCSNLDEVKEALNLYKKGLTPAKCASFISHLYKVKY